MSTAAEPQAQRKSGLSALLAPEAAPRERHAFFTNGPTDFLCIGGFSLLLLAAMAFFLPAAQPVPSALYRVSGFLTWVGNWPHFAASSYRLYHSRDNIRQYPFTAILIPFVVLAGVAASFAAPYAIAPFFVKIFRLWSPYHYSGQAVGISLIYARREGFVFGKIERWAMAGFIFSTFLYSNAFSETGQFPSAYYGVEYPALGIPGFVPAALSWIMYGFGAVFLMCVVRWSIKNHRTLPLMVLLPAVTQFAWFIPGNRIPAFNTFVPFFHSFQYLVIAWAMQMGESLRGRSEPVGARHLLANSARWAVVIFVGGAALFWALPWLGVRAGLDANIAEPILIAGVQIHHFFVDGVIWKLRDPKVRNPLLFNIQDLLRKPAVAA